MAREIVSAFVNEVLTGKLETSPGVFEDVEVLGRAAMSFEVRETRLKLVETWFNRLQPAVAL